MLRELLSGLCAVIVYCIVCASLALVLRRFVRIPSEIFRKILHFILLGTLPVWLYAFSTWWVSALANLVFAVVVFPILWLAERIKGYSKVLVERRSGEIKTSLLVVFFMFAVVISICWGWLGDRLLALACIYGWGFGDAAAALVGKRFGRHHISRKGVDSRKSAEGSAAMFAVSFVCILVILLVRGQMPWYGYIITSAVAAAVSALVELYTPNGMDTISCPLAVSAVLLPLVYLLGGMR